MSTAGYVPVEFSTHILDPQMMIPNIFIDPSPISLDNWQMLAD